MHSHPRDAWLQVDYGLLAVAASNYIYLEEVLLQVEYKKKESPVKTGDNYNNYLLI